MSGLTDRIQNELRSRSNQLFEVAPLATYVAALNRYPSVARWSYVSSEVKAITTMVDNLVGQAGLELYHQLLLINLIERSRELLQKSDFSSEIQERFETNYQRILRRIDRPRMTPGYFLYPRICKDLGLANMRIIPVGMQVINLHRLPRSLFFRGYRPRFDWSWFILKLGGVGPIFEMHSHADDTQGMLEFNAVGHRAMCLRVAELLRRRPNVKGFFGASWMVDPVMEQISPELAYQRRLVVDNGGQTFCIGHCTPDQVASALLFSPQRRALYEQGQFKPKDYIVVWPRKSLIAWADRQ